MERDRDTGTEQERQLVRSISATAACRASSDPVEKTLEDIHADPETQARVMAGLGGQAFELTRDIPDASVFIDRPADGFIDALAIIVVPGAFREARRIAVILRPFAFVQTVAKGRIAVVAPQRYVTDFASIPAWARWAIAPFGRHAEAAVIHDWLYALGGKKDRAARKRADDIFRLALGNLGVGIIRRNLMHRAVRFGGKKAFGNESEMNFRRLDDLAPIVPPPEKAPFQPTVFFRPRTRSAQSEPVAPASPST
jgi:hypothetical protein